MPHVRESEPRPDDVEPRDRADGPHGKPSGELGGQPINADETVPGGSHPDPGGNVDRDRHPGSVESEPGNDL
jgi:hypothetical protein